MRREDTKCESFIEKEEEILQKIISRGSDKSQIKECHHSTDKKPDG